MPSQALQLVTAVFDGALTQQPRPLAEFVLRPTMPIRENYLYRFLVNLLWFARNYLNAVLVAVLALVWWFPEFLACTVTALLVHRCKSQGKLAVSRGYKALQLALCVWCTYRHGVWPGVLATVAIGGLVCLHAVLTPYTDEASRYYDARMKAEAKVQPNVVDELARPRTPVMEYRPMDFPGSQPLSLSDDTGGDSSHDDEYVGSAAKAAARGNQSPKRGSLAQSAVTRATGAATAAQSGPSSTMTRRVVRSRGESAVEDQRRKNRLPSIPFIVVPTPEVGGALGGTVGGTSVPNDVTKMALSPLVPRPATPSSDAVFV